VEAHTARTPATREAIDADRALIRDRGYAVNEANSADAGYVGPRAGGSLSGVSPG
jgi:hypothetical protein